MGIRNGSYVQIVMAAHTQKSAHYIATNFAADCGFSREREQTHPKDDAERHELKPQDFSTRANGDFRGVADDIHEPIYSKERNHPGSLARAEKRSR